MGKIVSDIEFKVGQRVKGTFMKYTIPHKPDSRVPVLFTGTIIHDFDDSSYEVELKGGQNILVELYEDDKMELDEEV